MWLYWLEHVEHYRLTIWLFLRLKKILQNE